MIDFYQILGVAPNATAKAIKTAYKALASANHPDKHPPEFTAQFTEKMAQINQAYYVLGDKQRRKFYDKDREASRAGGWQQSASQAWEEFKKKASSKKAEPKQEKAKASKPNETKAAAGTFKFDGMPFPHRYSSGLKPDGSYCDTCAGHGVVRIAVNFASQNIACPKC